MWLAVDARLLASQFLPRPRKPISFSPLAVSMFGCGAIAFAKNMTAQFLDPRELFGYFIGTTIVMIHVWLMPQFRSTCWPSMLDRVLDDDRMRSAWALFTSPERTSIKLAPVARHHRRGNFRMTTKRRRSNTA